MVEEPSPWVVDAFLPPHLRAYLEDRFWQPIQARATLETLREDPDFLRDPGRHPAMFSDHGVVHARDIANGVVHLVDGIDGLLLPGRPEERRRFVQSVGVATAYLHDIGMVDLTSAGRRIHAAYAAQAAFGDDVDQLVDHLVSDGVFGERLRGVAAEAPFGVAMGTVVREILSLTVAHSKSAVPAAVLDDRPRLRRLLRQVVFTDLAQQRVADRLMDGQGEPSTWTGPAGARYADPTLSWAWLVATDGPQAALADDVVDAIRALRAADVLRQRGSVLRTSGGFELCIDARTARAVCILRSADGSRAYVVTYDDDRCVGEANIRVAFITPQGDLRIAFHRGRFEDASAARRAARCVADVVIDISADVIHSFGGVPVGPGLLAPSKAVEDIRIELERPDDDPAFADAVEGIVAEREPSFAARLRVVADVDGAAPIERRRYHSAMAVEPAGDFADEVIGRMQEHGSVLDGLDRVAAFAEVRCTTVRSGETLMGRGSPPSFVYVPLGHGLVAQPGGGYPPAPLEPWVAVGATGIIRRAERNADVVAEREVDVLMIPAASFADRWLRPLEAHELEARLRPTALMT